MDEYWQFTDHALECIEGVLLIFSPLPQLSNLHEVVEWSCNFREQLYESLIKVTKSYELPHTPDVPWGHPILDCLNL